MEQSKQVDQGLLIAANCLKELQAQGIVSDPTRITRIQKSTNRPERRQVFRIDTPEGAIALKFDRHAMDSDKLHKEFTKMDGLKDTFPADGTLRVARPLYIDPRGLFIATQWIDAPTSRDRYQAALTTDEREAVVHRAGVWLGRLHATECQGKATFRLNVLTRKFNRRMERITARPQGLVDHATLEEIFARVDIALAFLHGRRAPAVVAHGDFHGGNLLMTETETFGIDCAWTNRRLAVQDIAQFLVDMELCPGADQRDTLESGVSKGNKAAFLAGYGLPIDKPSLTDTIYVFLFKELTELLKNNNISDPDDISRIKLLEKRLVSRLRR